MDYIKNTNIKPKYVSLENDYKLNDIETSINKVVKSQLFAVLATSSKSKNHTSLISFAISEDLSKLVFATLINTKKFKYIAGNSAVSLLIDNRCLNTNNINDVVAITINGNAKILEEKNDIKLWQRKLLSKHNNLSDFVNEKTCKIVLVDIIKYKYVSNFQGSLEYKLN